MTTSTAQRLQQYFATAKQRGFETNFRLGAENYEVWDEVEIGATFNGQNTFEVTEEDLLAFNLGVAEQHPLFVDRKYARKHSPTGTVLDHPLFPVLICFYCIGTGPGNWIRSPGARNPGQTLENFERYRVGEVISLRETAWDKWIRRDKHYLTYKHDFFNQDGVQKGSWRCTLILPPTREDLLAFARA